MIQEGVKIEMNTITIIRPNWEFITALTEPAANLIEHLERCGRTCYKSEDRITLGSAERFVEKICRNNHESVLEHAAISVRIICSRAASHQLVRHRIGAFSQESQRYVNYNSRGMQFICPPSIGLPPGDYVWNHQDAKWSYISKLNAWDPARKFTPTQEHWLANRLRDQVEYNDMIQEGVKPEDARYCLPNACKTELAVTFNCRMWRHVFRERGLNPRAQWEIRGIFRNMLDEFAERWPAVFGDLLSTGGTNEQKSN